MDYRHIGIMTVVFIFLKVGGYISWSWWLVLLPAYGSILSFLILVIIIFLSGKKKDIDPFEDD